MVDFAALAARQTANLANDANLFRPVIFDGKTETPRPREINERAEKVSNVSNVSTPRTPRQAQNTVTKATEPGKWLAEQERETPGYIAWLEGGPLPKLNPAKKEK